MQLHGIHHLTAVSADAPGNHAFYTGVLGMRLVKKTVNQDDVSAYHLFYADGDGQPRHRLTFFDWPVRARAARHDAASCAPACGWPAARRWSGGRRASPRPASATARSRERDGRLTLDFEDPEGQRLALVDDGGHGPAPSGRGARCPAEHQIRGLGPITISVPDLAPTDAGADRSAWTCGRCATTRARTRAGVRAHVYAMGEGGPAAELHVAVEPDLPAAAQGAGGVHHVAFRIPRRASTRLGGPAAAAAHP